MQAIEREGALDKLRTRQFAADRLFFQQVGGAGRYCWVLPLVGAGRSWVLALVGAGSTARLPPAPPAALRQVIPSMCAGKVMGPGGEAIKALSERTGCRCV